MTPLDLFPMLVEDEDEEGYRNRFRALLHDRYWIYAVALITHTRRYEQGLEFVDRLFKVLEYYRAHDEITIEEYERIDRQLIEFKFELLDKSDDWDGYVAYYDECRSKPYTKTYAKSKSGQWVDEFLVRETDSLKYLHFYYCIIHGRYEVIQRKIERAKARGRPSKNMMHRTLAEMTDDEFKRRVAWIMECAEERRPVYETQ